MTNRRNDEAPFVFGVRVEGETFTDRRDETERLKMNFKYGVNIQVFTPYKFYKLCKFINDIL